MKTVFMPLNEYELELATKYDEGIIEGFRDTINLITRFRKTGLSMKVFLERGHFQDDRYHILFEAWNTTPDYFI